MVRITYFPDRRKAKKGALGPRSKPPAVRPAPPAPPSRGPKKRNPEPEVPVIPPARELRARW